MAGLRLQLVADAGAALVALLVATGLSTYKPRALTAYGRRTQPGQGVSAARPGVRTRWYLAGIVLIVLVLLFVFRHLMEGGLQGHAP